jgi:hypothetical protein
MVMVVALLAGGTLSQAQSPDVEYFSRLEVSTDAMFMSRSHAPSEQIIYQQGTSTEFLNANQLDYGFDAGWRLNAAWNFDPTLSAHFSYFQLNGDDATTVETDDAQRPLMFHPPGETVGASAFRADAWSRFRSWEAYEQQSINEWLAVQLGFRFADFDDHLVVTPQDLAGASEHFYEAQNHLYGFHLGSEIKLWNRGRLRVSGILKGAVFFNRIELDVCKRAAVSPSGNQAAVFDQEDHGTFLGEAGVLAEFRLQQHVTLRAGYEVVGLTGVALAPEQIQRVNLQTGAASLDGNDGVVYHGGFAGVEISY